MFNFNNIPKFSEFNQWLMPDGKVCDVFVSGQSGFNLSESTITMIDSEKERFCHRPENIVYGSPEKMRFENDMDEYETYIVGTAFTRYVEKNWGKVDSKDFNPDMCWPLVEKCISWLRSTDFYVAPSSTRYHDAFKGGLCKHTLNVVGNVKDLMKLDKWKDLVSLSSAILVALVHDWCKINLYESYTRNVKNEQTGVWEKQLAYKTKDDPMMNLGHGVSSMYLAQSFFKLSIDESLAIRWHMGEYNVADNEMNDLHRANEKYPIVQLLQFADRLSIVQY